MRNYCEIEYNNSLLRGFHDKGNDETIVIITHGIGGNKLGHKYIFRQFADFAVKQQLSVLRVDFEGSGESDGKFEDTKHSDQVFQVEAMIKYVKTLGYQKIVLASTTIGCYSVWHASDIDLVKCYVNWNPICNFDRYETNSTKHMNSDGSIDMKGLFTAPSYTNDLAKLIRTIPPIESPVLLLQGMLDHEYKYDDARDIAKLYNWSYQAITDGNHLWDGNQVRNQLFTATVNFIKSNT